MWKENEMNKEKRWMVSIIVPIYYGKKYIHGMIVQVEESVKNVCQSIYTELIFVNDAPDDDIDKHDFKSENIIIRIFNTAVNRGIHGARIWGLSQANGEFILFLDQDDKITSSYLYSQLNSIGNADAVVCRCIHENRQLYNEDFKFEDVITKEYMMTRKCPIISPGQVLLRKESIPDVWKKNIMVTNCADDYLLWLCMAAKNSKFALNQEIVYEHVVDGQNISIDYNHMMESEKEMYGILAKQKVFDENSLKKISDMLQEVLHERVSFLVKCRKMFMMLNRIMECRELGVSVGKYLKGLGINRVAIYGNGYIGKRLMGELQEYSIKVVFFIDKNAKYLKEVIPVYKLEDAPKGIDTVIISMVENYGTVKENLEAKYGFKIYTVNNVIEDISKLTNAPSEQ